MTKPISLAFSLTICLGLASSSFALDSIDQSSKETAIGQSKTPWKSKPLPPDAIMKSAPTTIEPLTTVQMPVQTTIPINSFTSSWTGYLMGVHPAILPIQPFPIAGKTEDEIMFRYKVFRKAFKESVENYDRQSALSPQSRASGYALFVDGKIYYLDQHGNEMAIKAIEHSIKPKGFYMVVDGTLKGNIIAVDTMMEVLDMPRERVSKPNDLDGNKIDPDKLPQPGK